ncbi:MAG: FAD-dependent thymidylate synthase [bacterium]|nr:FAD-dependent thymidylate synthase [bacterium]
MFQLPKGPKQELLAHADEYVGAKVNYEFTPKEVHVLEQFFTNLDQKIFFVHGLPANVLATLGAMYSRMANPRGIRGVFVDTYVVSLIAGTMPEIEKEHGGKVADFLKARDITSLDRFYNHSEETRACYESFVRGIVMDPDYVQSITNTQRTKGFLSTWLDAYGHNSIARVASVTICFEGISILAAKSLEWSRPGCGFIERSTRYVNMTDPQWYPVENEIRIMGDNPDTATNPIQEAFRRYAELLGNNLDGAFPSYLRKRYGEMYAGNDADLKLGVMGESFDVLGNFLPAATLTSVCATASGEALPSILKHLLLDGTPENNAIVQMILKEAAKIGANQFCRHYIPTPAEHAGWSYLATQPFTTSKLPVYLEGDYPTRDLLHAIRLKNGFENCLTMDEIHARLYGKGRTDHDKLPNEFERVSVLFTGTMSFRGWRDLHRQGISTHRRTLLTPDLDFYVYDKPHPEELDSGFEAISNFSRGAWKRLPKTPVFMRQFMLPLGFNVGYSFGCNARQAEFCNWQRTDYSVNHEVRQVFLAMENTLRGRYKWWAQFSRADTTPKYVFARGKTPRELTE